MGFYAQDTYNYLDRAVCLLPLSAETHDPSRAAQSNDVPSTELVVDGSMEAVGIAAWTVLGAGAVVQKAAGSRPGGTGTQVLQVIRNGAQASAYQTVLTIGQRYHLTGWARGDGVSTPRVATGAAFLWTGTTSVTWQYIDLVFTTTNAEFHLFNQLVDGTVEFDDFSVQQCVELLSDGPMEATDVPAWTVGAGAVLTKSLVAPYQGLQSLQVAFGGAGPYASQFVLTVGKRYRCSGVARGDTTYLPTVQDGAVVLWTGVVAATWQAFSVDFTATTTELRLKSSAVAAGNCCFDAVSLVELRARTLDASGHGNHFLLGDGVTPTTMPTKLAQRGYSCDGGDYLSRIESFGLTGSFTLSILCSYAQTVTQYLWSVMDNANLMAFAMRFNGTIVSLIYNSGGTGYTTLYPKIATENFYTVAYDATLGKANVFMDGKWLELTSALSFPTGYAGRISIMAYLVASKVTGNCKHFSLYPFALTPTQVADLYRQVMAELNDQ